MYFKTNKKQWPDKRTQLETVTALIDILHFNDSLWDRRNQILDFKSLPAIFYLNALDL